MLVNYNKFIINKYSTIKQKINYCIIIIITMKNLSKLIISIKV